MPARRPAVGGKETTMSYLKTAILLAGLTGLFMGVGYLIGGASGALIAHELAHVKNHDTLLMPITATIAGAISMLAQFGMFFGGHRDNNSGPGIIGSIAMMVLAPLGAMLVQMAISRTREYAADDLGARICGQPTWLASALSKIANAAHQVPNMEAERNPATAHMFIINPLSGHGIDSLFSTHPSTENRVAELQRLAAELGTQAGAAPPTREP